MEHRVEPTDVLSKLYPVKEETTDVTFSFPNEKKLLRAHSFTLASKNQKFQDEVLYGKLKTRPAELEIIEFDSRTFDAYIKFLYTNRVSADHLIWKTQ